MIQCLAMSDNVQMAIVSIVGALIVALTPALFSILMSISKRLDRVEQNTNGNLSEQKAKAELAESRIPGITSLYGPLSPQTTIINDPTTTDPPKVITSQTNSNT